jgi:GNAT superfamily N-acetyltransferase
VTSAEQTPYRLGGFDRARLGLGGMILDAASFHFSDLRSFTSARSPNGTRSFSQMLAEIGDAPEPWTALRLAGTRFVVVASQGQESIGLSVIDPVDGAARDVLTWIRPQWRHQGLAAAMKLQAIDHVHGAGIDTLWGPSDSAARAFYEKLGLRA